MAKAKVTRKWLSENYYCCGVGYCELQYLLHFADVRYYTCGVYGWNFDAYIVRVDNTDYCITTGYRGMIREFTARNVHLFDERAKKYVTARDLTQEEKKAKVNELLTKFIEVTFKM